MEKNIKKEYIYYILYIIYITESLCCTPETNTTLYISYNSIIFKKDQVLKCFPVSIDTFETQDYSLELEPISSWYAYFNLMLKFPWQIIFLLPRYCNIYWLECVSVMFCFVFINGHWEYSKHMRNRHPENAQYRGLGAFQGRVTSVLSTINKKAKKQLVTCWAVASCWT